MVTIDRRRDSRSVVSLRLPAGAPVAHRVTQRLALRGWRGSLRLWQVVQRLWPLPSDATLLVGGRPMPIDLSQVIGPYVYYGVYERWELEVLARVVRPGSTCVDVGANDGLYTLAMRAAVGPGGRVVAVEPQPALAARLRGLVAATGGASVSVVPVAVGAAQGAGRLTLFPDHSGLATLRPTGSPDRVEVVDVPVRRLDAIEDIAPADEIDLLKIDVEGFEADVLDGATGLLVRGGLRAALIEVSAEHDRVARSLRELGTDHHLFRVTQVRRGLRYHASLEPLTPSELAARDDTFNLFVCRSDALRAVAPLIHAPGAPQRGAEALVLEEVAT